MVYPNWIIIFEDAQLGNAVFEDEVEARRSFENYKWNWNCWLYKLVERG